VEGLHPYRFRQTFAIELLRNRGNIFELKKIQEHEKLETVGIYLKIASLDIQRAQQANSPADRWKL
jgi:site-specific recombinase XerD